MPVTSELRTLKMFLAQYLFFVIYKCSTWGNWHMLLCLQVVQDILLHIVLIVQDYCIAAHLGVS